MNDVQYYQTVAQILGSITVQASQTANMRIMADVMDETLERVDKAKGVKTPDDK